MNNTKSILISLVIVIVNNIIGHFFGPNGIYFTPIVLIIISVLIGFSNKELEPIWKSFILAGLIILHDIGVKLFSEGTHDTTGLGWIHLFLFIGLLPSYGILISSVIVTKNETKLNKFIAIIIFPILIGIHLFLFFDLGLGRFYSYDWNV